MPGDVSSSGPHSSTTGRITLGGCTLEVGDSAGSTLSLASIQADSTESRVALVSTQGDSRALRRALAQREKRKRLTPSEKLEAGVEDASEVTSKIEHAITLIKEVASGNLDAKSLSDEADALLGLLKRLSRAKRWEDVLRVARCLSALLALVGRWIELLRSLRIALNAAEVLEDRLGEAWALHELGTLHLVAGRHADADRELARRGRFASSTTTAEASRPRITISKFSARRCAGSLPGGPSNGCWTSSRADQCWR